MEYILQYSAKLWNRYNNIKYCFFARQVFLLSTLNKIPNENHCLDNQPSIMYPQIYPLSETAITLEWGNTIDDNLHAQVLTLNRSLHQNPFLGFIESVPAYASLTIYYQAELIATENAHPFLFLKDYIETLMRSTTAALSWPDNLVSIPVCYDEAFGYDLDMVADINGISKENLIALHQQNVYKVYMMGFLPGFAYMGALDDAIATARKPTPRAKVEAGSVGIAGNQTGIYPLSSPGGWQIIGRTPRCLFDPGKTDPFLLKTGDSVKFYAITKEEFYQIFNPKNDIAEIGQGADEVDALVIKPGIYATLQDQGRFGFRAYGVPLSGAMDSVAHLYANALIGNTQNAATIECTMGGMVLQFKKDTHIALTGGGAGAINGSDIPLYQRHAVYENDVLEIRYNHQGIRTYIAVQGGFAAENIMNSRSTCPMAGIGMPLKKDTGLRFGKDFSTAIKKIEENLPSRVVASAKSIRVCPGPEYDWMTADSARQMHTQKFTLTNRCDRMGYHLQAEPLFLNKPREMLSSAVTKGTIQLTPNGQLIILMSDCQTTGGYPRVGQIAAVDLPLVAQWSPGETVAFTDISFAEAEALYLLQQKTINALFS